jgi:hypothetical protein
MVTIDIKQLLRAERQKRTTSGAAAVHQEPDEEQTCSVSEVVRLDDFAVGTDKLLVSGGYVCSVLRATLSHIRVWDSGLN